MKRKNSMLCWCGNPSISKDQRQCLECHRYYERRRYAQMKENRPEVIKEPKVVLCKCGKVARDGQYNCKECHKTYMKMLRSR